VCNTISLLVWSMSILFTKAVFEVSFSFEFLNRISRSTPEEIKFLVSKFWNNFFLFFSNLQSLRKRQWSEVILHRNNHTRLFSLELDGKRLLAVCWLVVHTRLRAKYGSNNRIHSFVFSNYHWSSFGSVWRNEINFDFLWKLLFSSLMTMVKHTWNSNTRSLSKRIGVTKTKHSLHFTSLLSTLCSCHIPSHPLLTLSHHTTHR
jgi:hypothetical protein